MADKIIHSYAGRYQWEVGRDTVTRLIPDGHKMSKLNGFVPSLSTPYKTWYKKDAYVGNPRGGAIRYDSNGNPINPEEFGLELRTVYIRNIPYPQDDPKRYDPLQAMRDNYAEFKAGRTTDGFLTYEVEAIQNIAVDYYNEFVETAKSLGEDVKKASVVDGIGVLLTTAGTATASTGIGAVVAGVGWLTQLLSGKRKLSKELQSTMEKGQKDLQEIAKIFNEYTFKESEAKTNKSILYLLVGSSVFLLLKKFKG